MIRWTGIRTTKSDGSQLWSLYRNGQFVRAVPNVGTIEESIAQDKADQEKGKPK